MTKQNKIDFINEVNDRFLSAENHSGSNNTLSYNVKVYGSNISGEEIREKITDRQREYHSLDDIYQAMDMFQSDSADMLSDEVSNIDGVKECYFAGRSGGYLEVEYCNALEEVYEEDFNEDIASLYKVAKELEETETKVSNLIDKRYNGYCKLINSKDYIIAIINNLYDDKDIAKIYKKKIKNLTDKLI